MDIIEFYKNNKLDINFDEVLYQEQSPETKNFYQPYCRNNNIDDKHRLYFHYRLYGKIETNSATEREIYIKVNNGLANRLRTLNSFWSFCKQTNAKLKVCWDIGQGWSDEGFLDLFKPLSNLNIEFISTKDYEEIRISGKYFDLDKAVYKSDFDNSIYLYIEPKKHIIETINKRSFCYDGDSCLEYMLGKDIECKHSIYSHIMPNKELQNYIDKILLNTPKINNSIGIHIRRGDSLNHPSKDLYRLSNDQYFEKNIENFQKTHPNTKFFLSTDCSKTNDYFLSKYKDIIFCNPYKKFVDSDSYLFQKQNQKDAVVDLFLLSKTKFIVGSNNSSFSSLAATIGNLELIKPTKVKNKIKLQKTNVIKIDYLKPWQFPAHTEKQAYLNHTNKNFYDSNKTYIAFPWASLIDNMSKNADFWENLSFDEIIPYFDDIPEDSYTVCQHILWKKLIPLWKKIGIKNIYVSHLTTNDLKDELNLNPWHLIASNAENDWLNKGMVIKQMKQKKYLFSFIGAYNRYYRSDIRLKLNHLFKNKENIFFKLKNVWTLNEIVCNHQIYNKSFDLSQLINKSKKFNDILSDSVFSLCPEGTGPNTIRLWESMSVGSVPVLFENDWVKPEIDDFDWDSLAVTIKNDEISDLEEKLKNIDEDKVQEMSLNCINAYNKFRLKTCF